MSFLRERQTRRFVLFLLLFVWLMLAAAGVLLATQAHSAKTMLLAHDEGIASRLLAMGVARADVANALTGEGSDEAGRALLEQLGLTDDVPVCLLPPAAALTSAMARRTLGLALLLAALLLGGSLAYLRGRERLYGQAARAVTRFAQGDAACRLPQGGEGALYRLFAELEKLTTMLLAQREEAQRTRVFLRETISDISHQLRTPLAAMRMYQEIMEGETDNPQAIRRFLCKTDAALERMERLIASMLKVTRLDAGSIVFERRLCAVAPLVRRAIAELTTRARAEGKRILLEGGEDVPLVCDEAWTAEAIGNVVKNALDHTGRGGVIRIA